MSNITYVNNKIMTPIKTCNLYISHYKAWIHMYLWWHINKQYPYILKGTTIHLPCTWADTLFLIVTLKRLSPVTRDHLAAKKENSGIIICGRLGPMVEPWVTPFIHSIWGHLHTKTATIPFGPLYPTVGVFDYDNPLFKK